MFLLVTLNTKSIQVHTGARACRQVTHVVTTKEASSCFITQLTVVCATGKDHSHNVLTRA